MSKLTWKSLPVPKKKKIHETHTTQVVYMLKPMNFVSLKFSGTFRVFTANT